MKRLWPRVRSAWRALRRSRQLDAEKLLFVAALMLIVGLLAALGPARRSLRIQASDALRMDA